jgi:ParB family chromosome partitioning protein
MALTNAIDASIIEQIEVKKIHPSKFAIRNKFQEKPDELEALRSSIREQGLLQPILVRPSNYGYEIIAGHRRYEALRLLHIRVIPCRICELTDKEAYEVQLIENIHRKSIDPIEEAEAFKRYVIEFGWGGVSELARRIGKSEEYVSQRIQILKLPENIQNQLTKGRISVSQAQELLTVPPETRAEVAEQVIRHHLTIKEIREIKRLTVDRIEESDDNSIYSRSTFTELDILARKAGLLLKVQLKKMDDLIEEANLTIEDSAERKEIVNLFMELRLKTHSMIDETILFSKKNTKL